MVEQIERIDELVSEIQKLCIDDVRYSVSLEHHSALLAEYASADIKKHNENIKKVSESLKFLRENNPSEFIRLNRALQIKGPPWSPCLRQEEHWNFVQKMFEELK